MALGSEPGDLRLLHGKGLARVHGALAHSLARGLEFPAGPFSERRGPEPAKHVVGGPQVLACFCPPLLAAQPFAEGLTEALAGADVVVDVSNSPSFEDAAVLEFFGTSTRNILGAEAAAGVGHHVALSVVGTERLAESGYMRAKIAQEKLIKNSSIPYTIVHATQFFEFAARMADDASDGDTVLVPPVLIQPMAAGDVAAAVCRVTLAAPLNNTIEIAGPEPLRFEDFVRQWLRAAGDQRVVVADPHARYFGARLGERALLPGDGAQLGPSAGRPPPSRPQTPPSTAATIPRSSWWPPTRSPVTSPAPAATSPSTSKHWP